MSLCFPVTIYGSGDHTLIECGDTQWKQSDMAVYDYYYTPKTWEYWAEKKVPVFLHFPYELKAQTDDVVPWQQEIRDLRIWPRADSIALAFPGHRCNTKIRNVSIVGYPAEPSKTLSAVGIGAWWNNWITDMEISGCQIEGCEHGIAGISGENVSIHDNNITVSKVGIRFTNWSDGGMIVNNRINNSVGMATNYGWGYGNSGIVGSGKGVIINGNRS